MSEPQGYSVVEKFDLLHDRHILERLSRASQFLLVTSVLAAILICAITHTALIQGWIGFIWFAVVMCVSLTAHEGIHALGFLIASQGHAHISFGITWAFLYTKTDDAILPKGAFSAVLMAPTIVLAIALPTLGASFGFLGESLLVDALHLTGCVGDWMMVEAIAKHNECTHVRDTSYGCCLLKKNDAA